MPNSTSNDSSYFFTPHPLSKLHPRNNNGNTGSSRKTQPAATKQANKPANKPTSKPTIKPTIKKPCSQTPKQTPNSPLQSTSKPQSVSDRHESSSLSSLPSDDDDDQSEAHSEQPPKDISNSIIPSTSLPTDPLQQSSSPLMDTDAEPSELGDDVCLEYTDFGQEFPVTWSESEYDEDHQTEEPADEFAELLLMDLSEGDHPFGLEQLEKNLRTSSKYSQIIPSSETESSTDEEDSHFGYMIIEEYEGESDEQETSDHISQSISGDDGATTDSLDEDDHSGLVRFGIEADDGNQANSENEQQLDEEDDASFFDVPPNSALGSMLTNFDLAVISTSDSTHPPDDSKLTTEKPDIKLPIMGTFSVDRQDGTNAGRTIIDEEKSLPLSPFTGTKVIRYNRFRKLRQQSCTGESEPSSIAGTPQADESNDSIIHPGSSTNANLPEPEFDISAFIRGISSIDENCSDGEKNAYDASTTELDGLSRWQRVPMTAFRRRMVMNCAHGSPENPDQMILDGAIQPSSSLGETLGLSSQPGRPRKRHAPSSLHLSDMGSSKFYTRRDHRRIRKTTSYNSNGKQSKLNAQSSPHSLDQLLLDSPPVIAGHSSAAIDHPSLADPPSLIDHSADAFHSRLFGELLDLDQGSLANQPCNTTTATAATITNTAINATPSGSSNLHPLIDTPSMSHC
ncbi:hypothetical protein PCASD_13146 [Puccinia coronata f. sp. avenae]|uniref:Uncharacterized protein n=1 Tax=Puccinia coronata f. sp. avenae TaxID=200324 RepID=A0A2N5U5Z2_9BASI|nr:hypothetical protein PCASD_13146 [Puccinia coronata f. sp. avenae]